MASELFKLMGTIAIDASSATQTIQAVITAGNDLQMALNGAEGAADNAGESFGEMGKDAEGTETKLSSAGAMAVWLGNQLTQLSNKLWNIGKEFLSTGFNFNLSMDTWTTAMQTLLGLDTSEAEAFIAKLHQFALDTPLSMSEVMNQATQLLATGTEQDDLIDTLSMLGDIAGGNSEKFSRIATAYWQVMSTGKLMAQDAHQLTQAGIPIWDLLVDYYNETGLRQGATVDALMGAAKNNDPISRDDFLAALQMATGEGGRYHNRMAAAMETGAGQIEKVKDQYEIAAGTLVEPFYEVLTSGVFEDVTATLEKFVEWLESNPEALQAVADAISEISAEAFTAIREFFDWMIDNDVSIVDVIEGIGSAFGVLFAASHPLVAVFGLISAGLLELMENKDKLDSWLSNTTLGGSIGVTQKEVELRGHTQEYLNMSAADYANDEEYQSARLAKLEAIEKAYTDLVMRVGGTEDQETLEKNLGMSVSDYMTAIRSDIDMLYKDGTTNANMQLLNSLIPLFEHYDKALVQPAPFVSVPGYVPNPDEDPDGYAQYIAQQAKLSEMESELQNNSRTIFDMISNWATSPGIETGGEDDWRNRRIGTASFNLDNLIGDVGSGGLVAGILAGMQKTLDALPGKVETAAQAGVAEGVSGITVNGYVTTGDVKLQDGTIVGALTPYIDLKLGQLESQSNWG